MSILPYCLMVPSISALTSSWREMLQGMTCASPPALVIPSATSLHASALREEITTLAPSLASNSAEERPMPRLEPVMTATLPVRSNGVFFIVGCSLGFSVNDRSPDERSDIRDGRSPGCRFAHPGYGRRI